MARSSLVPSSARCFDLPLFLTPAFAATSLTLQPKRAFATARAPNERPERRMENKHKGVSALRSTGTRVPLEVRKWELPVPDLDPKKRKEFKTNPNHGLWGFFNAEKAAMISPEDEAAFGRPWTYQELTVKDWDDLHKLYWACIYELNRSKTRSAEMKRVHAGYGEAESASRIECVRTPSYALLTVL
jgi:large subunit ribosomal protein L47